jgi:ATP-dependent RNA helicase RhlE
MFKSGKIRVLVATDLIARGIDIQFLPFVINYELPRSPKDYIHRIGRTGRAESPGEAISLITPDEEHHFKVIQKKMKKQVEMVDGDVLV